MKKAHVDNLAWGVIKPYARPVYDGYDNRKIETDGLKMINQNLRFNRMFWPQQLKFVGKIICFTFLQVTYAYVGYMCMYL